MGHLGRATCIVQSISAQTSQEGIKCIKAIEQLRSYCLIYILCTLHSTAQHQIELRSGVKICCCFAYDLHSKRELRKATRCHSESFLFQPFYSQSTNFISLKKKIRLFFAMNSQVHAKNLQLQRQRLEVHTYIRSRAYFYFANFHREKRASRSQIYNKNTYGNRKVSKRGQILHCATVEIPHCVGSIQSDLT